MSVGCRRNAAVIGSLLLLCSLGFGAWVQVTSGTSADLYGVHFPEGTLVGYAVGSSPEGGSVVIKTTDGGTTWAPQTVANLNALYSVYFKDNMNGYAVGAAGTAIRTTNGGDTWTDMTVTGTDNLTRVQFPENGQIGYIGLHPRAGRGKVLKTTDGGASWEEKTVGGLLNTSRSCGMATDNIGIVVGNGGFVSGTTNGFDSSAFQGPQTVADLTAAAFSPDDPNTGYLIGNDTVEGVIRYTADGGASLWQIVRHYPITTYYGVDVPTTNAAYVCGPDGRIDRSVSATDFYRTTVPSGVTGAIYGLCFPVGEDTGYAVGAAGTILRTYDKGIPWIPGIEEGKAPAITRAGIRVLSNPCRHGIALESDAAVSVSVFDAAGRVVMSRAATRGLNFLPLPTGAYFVKAGGATARAVVTD